MADAQTKTRIKPNLRLAEPGMYKVIYRNDEKTTMKFVVESLIDHFSHSVDAAQELTERIHENGSAVVAVLPHEIAEQKGIEVTVEAHNQGYPLKVEIEQENL